MATINRFIRSEINRHNSLFSPLRAIIESTFYENNVTTIKSVKEAYHLARTNAHTIITDLNVQYPDKLGLPLDAKILVENTGAIVGRTASARRIVGQNKKEDSKLLTIIREAVYQGSKTERLRAEAYVGLDQEFMVKAHLSLPKGQENNLYSWLLNFQARNDKYDKMYSISKLMREGDIFIYSDPCWHHPDYPSGLVYFDPDHNTAIILGLNYFGELKKATLTLTWNIANKVGYVSCHGGQKKLELDNDNAYVAAFFGLSGSGKSTLTHARHDNKYKIEVLHDDAFIISLQDGSSIALEPAYFDKTQDYPIDNEEIDYFLTVQNVGVVLDSNEKKVLLTEDIRNGNGRTVKSRYSTPNRKDRFDENISAIYWIMKDDSLPPVLKISDPVLSSTFGATLATKRSTAEELKKGTDIEELVIEPYANPFRVYPLIEEYTRFKELFELHGVNCYILNTGFFLDKKIPKELTLNSIELIVEDKATFESFNNLDSISYMVTNGFEPDFNNESYTHLVGKRMEMRAAYIEKQNAERGLNVLPIEALEAIKKISEKCTT